jgi:hypothetical protein
MRAGTNRWCQKRPEYGKCETKVQKTVAETSQNFSQHGSERARNPYDLSGRDYAAGKGRNHKI